MNPVKFDYATVEYKEPIVYIRFIKGVSINQPQMLEIIEARKKLTGNKPHLVLTVVDAQADFTPDARKAAANARNASSIMAHAVVVKWLGQRLITNVFKEVDKPAYPLQIFTDEKEAEEWLMEEWKKAKK